MPAANTRADSLELLTAEQVMDILISDAVLRRSAATCVLPGVLVKGAAHFRRSDLEEWIRLQRALAAPVQ